MRVLIDGVEYQPKEDVFSMAAMPVHQVRCESETQLLDSAKRAVSDANWAVGQAAALWMKRYARGRTDADFAAVCGLTTDQIYERRRVHETFSDVRQNFPGLLWSHFFCALTWDDAGECLTWANDIGATVAEMKAWRRAQRVDDDSDRWSV